MIAAVVLLTIFEKRGQFDDVEEVKYQMFREKE
jgi:hypothetical protein